MIEAISAIGADDWRKEIVDYLKDPSKRVERRVRFQATKYVLNADATEVYDSARACQFNDNAQFPIIGRTYADEC
jgi:hypothetical protein